MHGHPAATAAWAIADSAEKQTKTKSQIERQQTHPDCHPRPRHAEHNGHFKPIAARWRTGAAKLCPQSDSISPSSEMAAGIENSGQRGY
jgi:hypothetical protein